MASVIRLIGRLRRGALSVGLLAALLAVPAPATANVNVTVGATTYNIQFLGFNRSYLDDQAAIQATPWWGNATLANNIATAFLNDIGVAGSPFTDDAGSLTALLFAYETFIEPIGPTPSVRAAQLSEGFPGVVPPGVAPTSERAQSATSAGIMFASGSIVPAGPVAVPEIDGNALVKALFCLFALGLWLQARRRRVARVGV